MKVLTKIAACLGLVLAWSVSAGAQDGSKGKGVERAALESFAKARIAQALEEKVARPADPARTAEEVQMITDALSDGELRALAGGEEVDAVIAPAIRNLSAAALGNGTTDLLFVPLAPCRIIDTRNGGGRMQIAETRSFQVAGVTEFGPQGGNIGGCGVPPGTAIPKAAAVMLNVVAIEPTGGGNLLAWPYGQDMPNASTLNFQRQTPLMNIANGLIVPIAGTNLVPADLQIQVRQNQVHIVADVMGYFTRFPVEQFQSSNKTITVVTEGGAVELGSGACTEVSSCTITSNSAGKVIVRTWSQIQLDHGTNVGGDRIAVGVKNADPTSCTNNDQSINATDFELPDSLPAENDIDWTLSHKRIFTHSKGARTYYINARMITGASTGDRIQSSRMVCTFIPD